MSARRRGSPPAAGAPPWPPSAPPPPTRAAPAPPTGAALAQPIPPADTPPRPAPPQPTTVRRVGGGFEYVRSERYTEAAAAVAAYDTYRALPPGGGPHTATDVAVLAQILRAAEAELDCAGDSALGQQQVRCQPASFSEGSGHLPTLLGPPALKHRAPTMPLPAHRAPAGHAVPGAACIPAGAGGHGPGPRR